MVSALAFRKEVENLFAELPRFFGGALCAVAEKPLEDPALATAVATREVGLRLPSRRTRRQGHRL